MHRISLHAKNDNWAIRERKRTVVNLRNACICADTYKSPGSVKTINITSDRRLIFIYQPIKKRSKKYNAFYHKGAFFVSRPPTNTKEG